VDGVDLAGDLLRDFEGEPEVRRYVREEAAPEFLRGELVEGEIAADRGEDFGVLAEAFLLEQFLREAAAGEVSVAMIDLVQPAFVFPGAAPDEDIALGERAKAMRKVVARKIVRFVEERAYHACIARK
jgi:hypothetical protein